MTRILRAVAALAVLLAAGGATRRAEAQDVVDQAHRRGIAVPKGYLRAKQRDPKAFEFTRAWKSSLVRARAARARMAASGLSTSGMAASIIAQRAGAVTGTFRVPVLPFLYSNTTTAPYATSELQNQLFDGAPETVTSVYNEMSRGLLTLTGAVAPWSQVSQLDSYYEGTDNGMDSTAHLGALFKEVLDRADANVDFSQYDSDGDGYVDFVAFVQPEVGGECGGNANLWSHRYSLEGPDILGHAYKTKDVNARGDTIKVADYVLQPGLNCSFFGGGIIDIGVFAHEFGHAFGLPDLYATNDANEGVGEWGLMSSGNWNQPSSPAHMESWSKMEMGWAPVVTISHDTTGVTLAPNETNGNIIRIDVPGTSEYFLLENRQALGSDVNVHGTGLLVLHIDSNTVNSKWPTNSIENTTNHKGVDVVEAYGIQRLDNVSNGYRGSGSDVFPGTSVVTSLTPSTTPNTNGYTKTSGISITNIAQSGQNVTFNVSFAPPGTIAMKWGDLDGDGAVTQTDVEAVYDCLVGLVCPAPSNLARADVDGDARVTTRDALVIHSYVVGNVDVSAFRVGQDAPQTVAPLTLSPTNAASARPAIVVEPKLP